MSRKRSKMPDIYRNKKRICTAAVESKSSTDSSWHQEDITDGKNCIPSDTKAALLYIKSMFPTEKFEGRIPPVIIKHQLYSIVKSRTKVDKELDDLRKSGEVRLFRINSEADGTCLVFTDDYKHHVLKQAADSSNQTVIDKFLTSVLDDCSDLCLHQSTMINDFHFKDEDITQLVKAGVLTVRDVGSWWCSIPGAGIFIKTFTRGRKAILTMIRKSKYKEILRKELENRKLPKPARLGILYHIHDVIGADLVQCIQTTSGQLLRLIDT